MFLCSNNDGSFEASTVPNLLDDQRVPSNEMFAHHQITGDETQGCSSSKRLKISEINISRYEQEFVEIKEIASGTFGTVKVARHRLDGMVYAIKVSFT